MAIENGVENRAKGCLYGQAIGDALGARYEFKKTTWVQKKIAEDRETSGFLPILSGSRGLEIGQITDDTEMAMALARSLLRLGRNNQADVACSYVRWFHTECQFMGNTTYTALRLAREANENGAIGESTGLMERMTNWFRKPGQKSQKELRPDLQDDEEKAAVLQKVLLNSETHNMNSLSNGCLMRICPLAIAGLNADAEKLLAAAADNCRLTNPNEIAVDAVRCYVIALRELMLGAEPETAYEAALSIATTETIRELLEAARERELPVIVNKSQGVNSHGDDVTIGYLGIALQFAFYELLHAATFEEALVRVVGIGGDADTNGCIVGAMIGARFGADGIPEAWKHSVTSAQPARLKEYPEANMNDLEKVAEDLARMPCSCFV